MTIKDFCRISGLTEAQCAGERIGGDLDLSCVTTLEKGVTLNAGGDLYLDSLTTLEKGVTLNAGGHLYLRSVTTLEKGVTLNAGGDLYLGSVTTPWTKAPFNPVWCGGKYIYADGILSEVVSSRGNVYRVRRIARKEVSYLVTNGNGAWSHGATLAEARADLLYKLSDRDTSRYVGQDVKKKMTFDETVAMYRTITGACAEGCKMFVRNKGLSTRKKYSINDIAKLTNGAYGSDVFSRFNEQAA